jgi:O-antigen ligase
MIERLREARPSHSLALAGLLMLPLAVVAPLSLAPLLALTAIGAAALGGYRDIHRLVSVRPLVLLLMLLGALGALSAAWSIIPMHSFLEGLRFLAISASGLIPVAVALNLAAEERERLGRLLLAGFVVALAALAIAGLTRALWDPAPASGGIARWLRHFTVFDRGATVLGLAIWAAVSTPILRDRRASAVLLALATLAVALMLRSRSAMLCLLVGLAVWPVAYRLPRVAAGAIGAAVLFLALVFPAAPLSMDVVARLHQSVPQFDNSMIHRFAIWHFAIDRIAERPVLGWGLDASRALPGGTEIIDDPRLPELARPDAPWMPLHPHNAALQWRLELGWPGSVLAVLVILWLLRQIVSTPSPSARASALALVAGTLVVAMLSYGFWQAWWQSSLWLIGALMVALNGRAAPQPARPAAADR